MEYWTKAPGHPLVTIIRNYQTRTITFKQERFTKVTQSDNTFWWILLDYLYADNGSNLSKFWMENKTEVSLKVNLLPDRAMTFNSPDLHKKQELGTRFPDTSC